MKKNEGKIFEEDFVKSFPQDIFCYRFRDSAGAWGDSGGTDKKTRFTAQNICDYLAMNHWKRELLMMELKSTKQKNMPFSNLSSTQINGLFNAGKYEGVAACFVFNFRTVKETYAISSQAIYEYMEEADRKSFPLVWCRENGILIPAQLKRTRHAYDIKKLLQ